MRGCPERHHPAGRVVRTCIKAGSGPLHLLWGQKSCGLYHVQIRSSSITGCWHVCTRRPFIQSRSKVTIPLRLNKFVRCSWTAGDLLITVISGVDQMYVNTTAVLPDRTTSTGDTIWTKECSNLTKLAAPLIRQKQQVAGILPSMKPQAVGWWWFCLPVRGRIPAFVRPI